jgi:CRISPR-associated protein Csc1
VQYSIYRCDFTLHDYLFFASTERGKVAETASFVYNYALTYALNWVQSVWHNEQQRARYREDLTPVRHRYITPARLVQGTSRVMQYNTLSEQLKFEKQRSIGYPDWGFIKCFNPGTRFRAYVITAGAEKFPRYVRLGKFMAKTKIDVVEARSVSVQSGNFTVSHLLNWNDLRNKPVAFNVQVMSLPSRLISQAVFESAEFFEAKFPDDDLIRLPLDMGYLLDT